MNDADLVTESDCIDSLNAVADSLLATENLRANTPEYFHFITTMAASTEVIYIIAKRQKFAVAEKMGETLGETIISIAVATGFNPDILETKVASEIWAITHKDVKHSETVR